MMAMKFQSKLPRIIIQILESTVQVELGFPNEPDDAILEYAEDPGMPTDTVYGFVPIDLAEELIQKHGGIIKASHFEED